MQSLILSLVLFATSPALAQDTVAVIDSEVPGLEAEVRVEIPGLSNSPCLQEAFSFKQELSLEMFEDVSDHLIRILERRGTPLNHARVNERFEQKGGWSLGEERVNDAYCNAMREELSNTFGLPVTSTWRQLVAYSQRKEVP